MTITLNVRQYNAFLNKAKKYFPNEFYIFLIGIEQPLGNFIVSKFFYPKKIESDSEQVLINLTEFKKELLKIKKTGKTIIGFLHTHCFDFDAGAQLYATVPSSEDYGVAELINKEYDKDFKVIGITAVIKNKNKLKESLVFFPTRGEIDIKWQETNTI